MKKHLSKLYVQVMIGILLGIFVGHFFPALGVAMKPLSTLFIKLIKMMLAPIIFASVVVGIARSNNVKEAGKVGVKALIYFEIVSTIALVIGLVVVNVLKPGVGMNIDPAQLDASAIKSYTTAAAAQSHSAMDFILGIIPNTVVGAFSSGEMLPVIFFSVLFAVALSKVDSSKSGAFLDILDTFLHGMFGVVKIVMYVAPFGAFGGMAFTIGKYGIGVLSSYGQLIACLYITCALFIFIILGGIMRACGFSLMKFIAYIKNELLITLGTNSTEAVLPQMLEKLERVGCNKSVVGMVLPTGYTFNADGTAIYLTMGAIFIAQAMNINLSMWDQLVLLGTLLLTSKGSAGVAGAGFVALAATLSSLNNLPVAGLVLLLGVDSFLNAARALTNLIGNGVATLVVAKWEGEVDMKKVEEVLNNKEPDSTLAMQKI